MDGMITSSTTATSFTACAANRWRSSTWSIGRRCFPARPIVWPGKNCWRTVTRGKPAKQWCRCWRWRMTVAAKPNLPRPLPNRWPARSRSTLRPCRLGSRRCSHRCPTSSSLCRRSPATTSFSRRWEQRHERQYQRHDQSRHRATAAAAARTAAADHRRHVAELHRTRRSGRLASGTVVGHPHRVGTRRSRSATHPATSARGPPATRQNTRQFRFYRCADAQSRARCGAHHRRWMDRGGTILLFGPSGSGKSHLSAAFGHALIENGYRVLFTRTTDLVQRLQQARQALSLESAIEKLDKYHLIILEDLCYVRKDQAETSVLFELIAARYERRSLIVTANHPFGEWTSVFPDAAMTLAAVDRLVHPSPIFELNVQSYRRGAAAARAPRKSRGLSDKKSDSDNKRDNDSGKP